MIEALWVLLLLVVLGAITAARTVASGELIEFGNALMLGSSAVGIPLELIYFVLLAIVLRGHAARPKGWYWRSFEHHHLLSQRERTWVLPFFYLGALAFLGIVLGVGVVVLGVIAALQQS